ncbi:hypothetical protein MPDQ_001893 [Monascus purpureus]|uniref:Mitochondrial resolvase Ydc2 catalytic domain-containing protein n=1 Tax=Monascus purpureus TaxID=5098 RepID=A0A507QQP1_MONPU|nr:hypothetical protein MPDQ_001893 [Monascus purpureus]BDD56418.1 hypothetical protein MAP00_001877 [Monascus purpureus]
MKPNLSHLKTRQLVRLAQIIGVTKRGPKLELAERISREISAYQLPLSKESGRNGLQDGTEGGLENANAMSILSLDVGIQNLGIANFIVPPFEPLKSSSSARSAAIADTLDPKWTTNNNITPILNGWQCLKVSDMEVPLPPETQITPEAKEEEKDELTQSTSKKSVIPFSTPAYAARAYTLITSLLEKYKPTHVLIEKQRFRSGGGVAVQEWTLRVGVLEGMLYAVLYTLKQQQRQHQGTQLEQQYLPPPLVHTVDPQQVIKYWRALSGSPTFRLRGKKYDRFQLESPPTKTMKMTPADVKRTKIDLVGTWLSVSRENENENEMARSSDTRDSSSSYAELDITSNESIPQTILQTPKVQIATNPQVRDMVDIYLRRWDGGPSPSPRSSRGSTISGEPPPRKLDDLADCLLQGVTWLDWQVMRYRVLTEGIDDVLSSFQEMND